MMEMWNLWVLHAALHPIERIVEPISSAREAENHFARKQMLFHAVLAQLALLFYIRLLGMWKL